MCFIFKYNKYKADKLQDKTELALELKNFLIY